MMMRMLALTTAVAVGTAACCSHGLALANERVWQDSAGRAFGKEYVVSIPMRQFKRSPKWRPKDDNPPLSARRAMEIAECQLSKHVAVPEDYRTELKELVLRKGPYGRWFWEVNYVFYVTSGGSSGMPPSIYVSVLMDGSVGELEVSDLD